MNFQIKSMADIGVLPTAMKLPAMAALEAGVPVEIRTVRHQSMLFATLAEGVQHFHPLTNWSQCLELLTHSGARYHCGWTSIHVTHKDAGLTFNTDLQCAGHGICAESCKMVVQILAGAYGNE